MGPGPGLGPKRSGTRPFISASPAYMPDRSLPEQTTQQNNKTTKPQNNQTTKQQNNKTHMHLCHACLCDLGPKHA